MQSYAQLTPDNSLLTVQLLQDISVQLHSLSVNQSAAPSTAGTPSSFKASTAIVTTNTLWFLSLVCSLASAQLGIFLKQWTRNYTYWTVEERPQLAAGLRQYRYEQLHAWSLPRFVAVLSALLQMALVLFFAGLLILVWPLDIVLASIITFAIGLLLCFAAVTTALPAFVPAYPFRTPFSVAVAWISNLLIPVQLRLVVYLSGRRMVARFRQLGAWILSLGQASWRLPQPLVSLKKVFRSERTGDAESGQKTSEAVPTTPHLMFRICVWLGLKEALPTALDASNQPTDDYPKLFSLDADWLVRDLVGIEQEPKFIKYRSTLRTDSSENSEKDKQEINDLEGEMEAVSIMSYTARSLVHLRGRQQLSDDIILKCMVDLYRTDAPHHPPKNSIRIHFATLFFAQSFGCTGSDYAALYIQIRKARDIVERRCTFNTYRLPYPPSQLPSDPALFGMAASCLRSALLSALGARESLEGALLIRFIDGLLLLHSVFGYYQSLFKFEDIDDEMEKARWEYFEFLLQLLNEYPSTKTNTMAMTIIPFLAAQLLNDDYVPWGDFGFLDSRGRARFKL